MITEKFKEIIDQDIAKCEIFENSNNDGIYRCMTELFSKYTNVITGFARGMHRGHEQWTYQENIKIIKVKLELFKAMGYENISDANAKGNQQSISINNSNYNKNSNSISVNISFEEIRKEVEKMSTLPESEILEILVKVDELEKIVLSKERKSKKWEKAKEIIKWIADKGVDVGLTLLTLLLKIE